MRMDHKIYNEAHFKSGGRERRGAQTCLEETCLKRGVGRVCPLLKVVQHMHIEAYTATPRMCIDYTATLYMHIVCIGHTALGGLGILPECWWRMRCCWTLEMLTPGMTKHSA